MVVITNLEDSTSKVPAVETINEDESSKLIKAGRSDGEAEEERKHVFVSGDDDDGDDDDDDDDNECSDSEGNADSTDDENHDLVYESETNDNADENEEKDDTVESKNLKSGMDRVKDVLERAAREAEKNKSIQVEKGLDLQYDLGTLLAIDTNELDLQLLRDSKEEYLKNLARDNTQLLINHIWELPITRRDTEIVAKLPRVSSVLPREKPIPKEKTMTKWEKFAQEKGIQKKQRAQVQWDETLQKWVPWWGYKRAKAEKEKNWLIEVRKNDNPTEDPFAKKKAEKQERVAKNEYQRLRNLARAKNVKIPRTVEAQKAVQKKDGKQKEERSKKGRKNLKMSLKGKKEQVPRMGLLTSDKMNSAQIKQAITIGKASTASLGKFQRSLPKEKDAKNTKLLLPMARKRRAAFLNPKQERDANISIIDGILNKKPRIDVEKAVNRRIRQEKPQKPEENTHKPKGKGRGKKGGEKGNTKGRVQGKAKKGGKASAHKGGAKQKSGGGKKR